MVFLFEIQQERQGQRDWWKIGRRGQRIEIWGGVGRGGEGKEKGRKKEREVKREEGRGKREEGRGKRKGNLSRWRARIISSSSCVS